MPSLLHSWVFDRDRVDFGAVVRASQDGDMGPPGLQLSLLSSTGDTITVQVVDGIIPLDPDAVFYVQGRGTYEMLRRECWPGGRTLLTLAAWPRR